MKWRATLCTLGAVLLCTSLVASAEPPEHSTAAVKPAVDEPIMVTAPPREAPPRETPAALDKPKKETVPGDVRPTRPSLSNVEGSAGTRGRADYYVTAPYAGPWRNTCGAGDDCTMHAGPDHTYEVTVLSGGVWTFSLCGSAYDTYMYVGTTLCGQEVGYNDDYCGLQSQLTAAITAGTYYVDVEGFAGLCGDYVLNIWKEADFSVAAPYISPTRNTCGEGDDCTMHPGPDHTYEVGIPHDGTWTFSLCGSSYDTYMYVGTTLCGYEVGYNDDWCGLQSQLTATITAGTYYVDVEGYAGSCGDYVLSIFDSDLAVAAPAADETGNTCGAGNDCALRDSEEITYLVHIPDAGDWTFSLCGSDFDTYLFVGTTLCGQEVGYNDDYCGLQSQLTATIDAGYYYVAIEGYASTHCGNYVLNIWQEGGQPPPNDDCEDAQVINSPYPVTVPGTNIDATIDCPGLLDWEGVWYDVELPYASNDLTVTICPTDYDVVTAGIVVMDDCACDDYIGCSDYTWIDCPSGYQGIEIEFWQLPGPGRIYFPLYVAPLADYEVTFNVMWHPSCDLECPPGGIDEGEPVCYDGYVDNYNGGCNSTPPIFQPIACGDVICGTSGVYDFNGVNYRDTDWFEIMTNAEMTFTWSAVAEFPVLIFIIDGGSGDCLDYTILGNTTAPECELASLTIGPVPAGRYWFWVGPQDWGNYPCGVEYVAELTCVGGELGACCFPDGHCEELTQGECEKMHYPQLPDPSGWDVMATRPLILADDFLCTWSGPLTNIRFWGSWQGDQVGELQIVRLSIHEDIPAEQSPTGYSMPGALLWAFEEWPGPPGVEPESWQGWFDPAGPVVIENDHQLWFQYDMVIPEEIAFFQEAGTIYWLNIQAITEGGVWGWKTSVDHWNDNAVWGVGEDPEQIEWQELTDPVTGRPLDLAFMIAPGHFLGVGTDCDPNPCPPGCIGDVDGDRDTDLRDLAILLSNYGMTSGAQRRDGDLDGDGDVDLRDLAILLSDYGCPP